MIKTGVCKSCGRKVADILIGYNGECFWCLKGKKGIKRYIGKYKPKTIYSSQDNNI